MDTKNSVGNAQTVDHIEYDAAEIQQKAITTPSIHEADEVDEAQKPDVLPPLEKQYLHGRKLVLAFTGWLMTEFMGGMVSRSPVSTTTI